MIHYAQPNRLTNTFPCLAYVSRVPNRNNSISIRCHTINSGRTKRQSELEWCRHCYRCWDAFSTHKTFSPTSVYVRNHSRLSTRTTKCRVTNTRDNSIRFVYTDDNHCNKNVTEFTKTLTSLVEYQWVHFWIVLCRVNSIDVVFACLGKWSLFFFLSRSICCRHFLSCARRCEWTQK